MGSGLPWAIVLVFTLTGVIIDLIQGGEDVVVPFADLEVGDGIVDLAQFMVHLLGAINGIVVNVIIQPLPGLSPLWAMLVGLIGVGSLIWGLLEAFGPLSLIIAPFVSALIALLEAIVP